MSQQENTVVSEPAVLDELQAMRETCRDVIQEVQRVVVGQDEILRMVMIAILVRGHCLLEGVPGLAKTLMVSTLARIMELSFSRIQFTPDLIPSDILGATELEMDESGRPVGKTLRKGPIFANLALADEINRASPKTQSALLEAMQERQVTIGDKTERLEPPFFVLATQNPIEQEGTYPLPEAQLDRFLFKLQLDYPGEAEEIAITNGAVARDGIELRSLVSGEKIIAFQELMRKVPAAPEITEHCVRLVRATRPKDSQSAQADRTADKWVYCGAGPRASINLVAAAKAHAVLRWEKDDVHMVTLDDVAAIAHAVLRHRIVMNYEAQAERISSDDVIDLLSGRDGKPER